MAVEGLSFHKIDPPPALSPFVECFWVLDHSSPSSGLSNHLVFPDGGIDLCVKWERYRGSQRLDKSPYVSGLALSSRAEPLSEVRFICGARFRPTLGAELFGIGGSDATQSFIPLDALWKNEGELLVERIVAAPSPLECLRNMATILEERLPRLLRIDPVLSRAARLMEDRHGAVSIAEIESLGLGARGLRRKFDRIFGINPKTYCRILRFSHAVDLARLADPRDWADVAVSAGYYDQSHFIQDFQEFSGTTPDRHFARVDPVRFFQYGDLASF